MQMFVWGLNPNRSLDRNMEIIRTLLLLFKSNDRFGLKIIFSTCSPHLSVPKLHHIHCSTFQTKARRPSI